MSDFLPKDYNVPAGGGNYMKFKIGENRFRILGSPIIGNEGWKDNKPVRKEMSESFSIDEIDDPEKIKHFWAMPVYNYSEKQIQILEITQKGIQRTIKGLTEDEEWGNPVKYDIKVIRSGEGMETEYEVVPSPHKELDDEIGKKYKNMKIDLKALFTGGDPFKSAEEITEKDLNDIEKMTF